MCAKLTRRWQLQTSLTCDVKHLAFFKAHAALSSCCLKSQKHDANKTMKRSTRDLFDRLGKADNSCSVFGEWSKVSQTSFENKHEQTHISYAKWCFSMRGLFVLRTVTKESQWQMVPHWSPCILCMACWALGATVKRHEFSRKRAEKGEDGRDMKTERNSVRTQTRQSICAKSRYTKYTWRTIFEQTSLFHSNNHRCGPCEAMLVNARALAALQIWSETSTPITSHHIPII